MTPPPSPTARSTKNPPAYAINGVDCALRLAVILQLEGALTVAAAADRLGVARSTAHRLLQMLVYRDFAVQHQDRSYRAGPVLEMSPRSASEVTRLRAAALGPLRELVARLDETANVSVRTGSTVRFVASVECGQALRVGSREGMAFPAHLVTGGLVMLAELDSSQLDRLYADQAVTDGSGAQPDLGRLRTELARVRRQGFALNLERSERGLVAVGCGVRDTTGSVVAAVSVSLPRVRYRRERIAELVIELRTAAQHIGDQLAAADAALGR